MKILVLGGGVVGVTTAFYLAKEGHKVSIIDRRPEVASECSYGNPGLIAPSRTYSMASPKIWSNLHRIFLSSKSNLRFHLRPYPALMLWLFRFLTYCTADHYSTITRQKLALCLYNLPKLDEVLTETGIEFLSRRKGFIALHRTTDSFELGKKNAQILVEQGLHLEFLDREALLRLEPALAYGTAPLAGGVYCPQDETGNPAEFARNLAIWLQKNAGVELRTEETIKSLEVSQGRVREVVTDREKVSADAFVLACGAASPLISKTIGLRLPIYPFKGYTLTAPINDMSRSPGISCVDTEAGVSVSRITPKMLRISFRTELIGYNDRIKTKIYLRPIEIIEGHFPKAANFVDGEYWTGLRPMTPHGLPLIGPTRFKNLFLNCGHGHLGWSTCCGSGKIISDLMAGREPDLGIGHLLHDA